MKLTQRLLSYLYRAIDGDPEAFTAFRLSSSAGVLSWEVADKVLTVSINGAVDRTFALDGMTVSGLAAALVSAGYRVSEVATGALGARSAAVLIDGAGSVSSLNGDRLQGYQSLTWAFLDACALALQGLKDTAAAAPDQMSTVTAEGEWLDELGSYYAVPRLAGESDAAYAPRIIAEVIAPKSNNVAIEAAVYRAFGQQATVTDVRLWGPAFPLLNGAINLDGSHTLNATVTPIYGLFDVTVGYDFESGPAVDAFLAQMLGFVGRIRAAGTHLRALNMAGGAVSDVVAEAYDPDPLAFAMAVALDDAPDVPGDDTSVMSGTMTDLADAIDPVWADDAAITLNYATALNGLRRLDGAVPLSSGVPRAEAL